MRIEKVTLFILMLVVGLVSCNNDDDNTTVTVEIRDRAEQQIVDQDTLTGYLQTHYYNSSFFEGNTNPKIEDLVITPLATGVSEAPDGSTLLIDAVETKTVVYADTDYEYYVLKLNQGGGESQPTFADNILVTFEGFTLDNEVFDEAINPVTFDLIGNGTSTFGLVPIWRKVLPDFNTAESFNEPGDGTVDYFNHGTGVMFAPSGLGYFSSSNAGLAYSCLIFKFELYRTTVNDHDGDGIPSYLEDINGDGEYTINYDDLAEDDTDDDSDGDGTPDYIDTDDDGDGIPTIYEDINQDGDFSNDDTNGNGIPNYLDPDDTNTYLDNE